VREIPDEIEKIERVRSGECAGIDCVEDAKVSQGKEWRSS
jgi:hypothetical protein